jgi:hypothetical protein
MFDQIRRQRERYNTEPAYRSYRLQKCKEWADRVRGTKKRREQLLAKNRRWVNKPGKRDLMRSLIKEYRNNHPNVIRAYDAVKYALRVGNLVRPKRCEQCGEIPFPRLDGRSRLQAHHYKGYARKNRLVIQWLCAYCHRQERGK